MKPLFLPLVRWAFEAFCLGTKTTEYRPAHPSSPWNERTCRPGREVILSLGYGRTFRRWAEVERFEVLAAPPDPVAWARVYGDRPGPVAAIHLRVPGPKGTLEELARLCHFPLDPASPVLGAPWVSLCDCTTLVADELPDSDAFRRAFRDAQEGRFLPLAPEVVTLDRDGLHQGPGFVEGLPGPPSRLEVAFLSPPSPHRGLAEFVEETTRAFVRRHLPDLEK